MFFFILLPRPPPSTSTSLPFPYTPRFLAVLGIPVALIGTFAVLASVGYSLNNLSLFGLVLAIGIVVDDAIVVVENVERNLEKGMSALEAARTSMDEVSAALVEIVQIGRANV